MKASNPGSAAENVVKESNHHFTVEREPGSETAPAAAKPPRPAAKAASPVSVVCSGCNSPQEVVPGKQARCVVCGKSLSGAVGVAVIHTVDAPSLDLSHSGDGVIDALLALVPGYGLQRVLSSAALSIGQRLGLGLLAIASTCLSAFLVWTAFTPRVVEPPMPVTEAVQRQISAIEALVIAYRNRTGNLPSTAAWKSSVATADSNLLDPWGRPYRYEVSGERFSVTTLGADDKPGGSGLDADVVREFQAPARVRP